MLWGYKFVNEMLNDFPEMVESVILGPDPRPDHKALKGISTLQLSKDLFNELDIFGTNTTILVCKLPLISQLEVFEPQGLELLVAVSDPSNLGTIIRSSASFGVHQIILLKEAASPFHPRAVRASAGNVLKMQYKLGPSIENLDNGILQKTLALDLGGESLASFQWPKNAFLLVGEEGRGLPKQITVQKIRIPTEAKVESLNASTAISIAMYAHYIQTSRL